VKAKLLAEDAQRTYALVFDSGDEVMSGLERFAREQELPAAQISGIGAFESVTLGYFDWPRKSYTKNRIDEQVEVVSLMGDVALKDGEPAVHAHVTLARGDASALGGHLIEAHVRPTLELIVVESPSYLQKEIDGTTGLALIAIDTDGETTH
jgi:predicted DNA-binding protein with PD1-like motif